MIKMTFAAIALLCFSMPVMAQAQPQTTDSGTLPIPRWEEGYATITGKTLNYDRANEDNPNAQIYPRSSFGYYVDKKHGTVPVDSAGNYKLNVKLYQTHQPCFIDIPGYYGLMYLSPGDSVSVTVDNAGRRANGHQGNEGTVVFAGGADSDINNMLATNTGHDAVWDNFGNRVGFNKKYSGNDDFIDAVMAHRAARHAHVDTLQFTDRMKHVLNLNIDCDAVTSMLVAPIYQLVEPDSAYYSFITELGAGSPMLRWASDYDRAVSYCSHLYLDDDFGPKTAQIEADLLESLLQTGKLDASETTILEGMLKHNIDRMPADALKDIRKRLSDRIEWLSDSLQLSGAEKEAAGKLQAMLADDAIRDARTIYNGYLKFIYEASDNHGISLPSYHAELTNNDFSREMSAFYDANMDAIQTLFDKYRSDYALIQQRREMDHNIRRFTEITGIDDAELRQNIIISVYSEILREGALVPDYVFEEEIKDFSPVAVSFLTDQNNVLRQVLAKSVSNVSQMSPDDDADKMILSLVEKHKGKMIFIDIWNTWCGACLAAMANHEKEKGDFTDRVAFVYLADESSPEALWNERIKNFTGDHYRLPLAQHQSIMQRFNFTGYPSYVIIDTNGDIVHTTNHIHSLSELDRWLK